MKPKMKFGAGYEFRKRVLSGSDCLCLWLLLDGAIGYTVHRLTFVIIKFIIITALKTNEICFSQTTVSVLVL